MRTSILCSIVWMICLALRATAVAAPAGSTGKSAAASTADDPSRDADDLAAAEGAVPEAGGSRLAVRGPTIGAVLTAAYAAAGLAHDPQDGWIRRARLAGLVPWLTVRTTHDTSWQDDSTAVGHSTGLEVRATWRLDRLVFDGKELQISALETARRRERRRLAARVIRAYFAWRRAASLASDDERVVTRVAETAAELDALTDGWFSDQRSPHRTPAATGTP